MTEREKIISLAKECGFGNADVCEGMFYPNFESFYHAAQKEAFEQTAKLVEDKKLYLLDGRYTAYTSGLSEEIQQLIKE